MTIDSTRFINPNWEEFSQVPSYISCPHEWRGYISKDLQAIWDTFTDEQKLVIGRNAEEIAGWEEWD